MIGDFEENANQAVWKEDQDNNLLVVIGARKRVREFLTQSGTSSRSTLNYARLPATRVIYRGWTRSDYSRHAKDPLVNSPRNESVTARSPRL